MTERSTRRAVLAAVAVALAAALVAWLVSPGPEATEREQAEGPVGGRPSAPGSAPTGPCAVPPVRAFVPRTVSVEGVTRAAEVMALPRDAAGVVGVPPVGEKEVFAWDRGGVRPGSREGHVLLNTHTWPDGTATGNALLRDLHRGGRVVLRNGARAACYRVTKRVEVRWQEGYPGWDATDGPPEVVIVVCSGRRLGPGRWTHRTLWFGSAVT